MNDPHKDTQEQWRGQTTQTRSQFQSLDNNLTSDNDTHKKNVQFRDLIDHPTFYPEQKGHNPILITPRHPYLDPSLSDSRKRDSNSSERYDPLDNRGKYFSGTVENGQGGDFCGYYFYPMNQSGPTMKNNVHPTSTPYETNHLLNTPVGTRIPGEVTPRRLFPELRNNNTGDPEEQSDINPPVRDAQENSYNLKREVYYPNGDGRRRPCFAPPERNPSISNENRNPNYPQNHQWSSDYQKNGQYHHDRPPINYRYNVPTDNRNYR